MTTRPLSFHLVRSVMRLPAAVVLALFAVALGMLPPRAEARPGGGGGHHGGGGRPAGGMARPAGGMARPAAVTDIVWR